MSKAKSLYDTGFDSLSPPPNYNFCSLSPIKQRLQAMRQTIGTFAKNINLFEGETGGRHATLCGLSRDAGLPTCRTNV